MALRNGELEYSYGDGALSSEPLALSPKAGVTHCSGRGVTSEER